MKVMRTINQMLILCLAVAMIALSSHSKAEEQAPPKEPENSVQQQENKWSTAGKEVKEAAGSVAEATTETAGSAWDVMKTESASAWEKTKAGSREFYEAVGDKSKEVWQTTKEESKNFWEKSKAKVHEATAPKPPMAPANPTPPVTTEPAAPAPADAVPASR